MATGTNTELRNQFSVNGVEIPEHKFYALMAILVDIGVAQEVGTSPKNGKHAGRPAKIISVPDEIVFRLIPKERND